MRPVLYALLGGLAVGVIIALYFWVVRDDAEIVDAPTNTQDLAESEGSAGLNLPGAEPSAPADAPALSVEESGVRSEGPKPPIADAKQGPNAEPASNPASEPEGIAANSGGENDRVDGDAGTRGTATPDSVGGSEAVARPERPVSGDQVEARASNPADAVASGQAPDTQKPFVAAENQSGERRQPDFSGLGEAAMELLANTAKKADPLIPDGVPAARDETAMLSTATGSVAVDMTEPSAEANAPVVRQRAQTGAGDQDAPSFDIVRVAPDGAAVFAGRAKPGAEVSITDRDTVLGTVTADPRGEWVFIPDQPLDSGERQLGLLADSDGSAPVESLELVVLTVPAQGGIRPALLANASETPLAILVPRDETGRLRLLQRPSPDIGILAKDGLSLDLIDYDRNGRIDFAGRGLPGNSIVAYVNGVMVGRATVDPDGTWRLVPGNAISPGVYKLRIVQLDTNGNMLSDLETPFSMADFESPDLGEGLVIVQPGNSLWRISKRIYGAGVEYRVIYDANSALIRDPDLIYPGQIFVVPQG